MGRGKTKVTVSGPPEAIQAEQLNRTAEALERIGNLLERAVMLGEHALSIIKFGRGRASMPISEPLDCPDCGQKMQWKVVPSGDIFAGCKNFPVCRGTRPYDAENSKMVDDVDIPF